MMTREERGTLAENLITVSKSYYREIDLDVARMMVNNLEEIGFVASIDALTKYCRDPKNRFPPLVADLLSLAKPKVDDRSLAIDLTTRLEKCIRRFDENWQQGYFGVHGNYWNTLEDRDVQFPTWESAALRDIGELGVAYVKRTGWKLICSQYWEMDGSQTGQWQAQTRERILSFILHANAGQLDVAPALPESAKREQLKPGMGSAADILKNILPMPKKKDEESDV